MSADTLSPPPPAVCLTRSYASRKIKGGTVIAEDVLDLDTHKEKLADPDEYRECIPPERHCGAKVHALCFRERLLRSAEVDEPPQITTVRMYRCPRRSCGAVFTVLPAFIARHLWRQWRTVEEVTEGRRGAPKLTQHRWLGRLKSSASQLVQLVLAKASSLVPSECLHALTKVTTRWSFLEAVRSAALREHQHSLAAIAAWIHRLEPGIRLM
jgi:hypothetical protein